MIANVVFISVFAGLALFGCDPDKKTPKTDPQTAAQVEPERVKHPGIDYEDGPMPTAETVLAQAGEHTVTIADYELASRLGLLFSPDDDLTEVPPEKMALPHVHVTLTQSLLMQKVVDEAATKRGMKPTEEAIDAYLAEDPKLSRFIGDGEGKLTKYGISPAQLREIGRMEVLKRMFQETLLDETTKEEVWQAYQMKMDVVQALIASARNLPSSTELDQFMSGKPTEISEYFEKHKNKFRFPERVKMIVIRPDDPSAATVDALQKASSRLGQGDRAQDIAKDLGWQMKEEKLLRPENKTAYDSTNGTAGFEQGGPRGSYAWLVTGREPARDGELTDAVRREIAAKLMQEQTIAPNVAARAEKAKQILKNATPKTAKTVGKKLVGLGFKNRLVQFNKRGFIDGFGLAEPVVADIFGRATQGLGGPIRSRHEVFIYKSFKRNLPDRDAFEKEYDAFREAVLQAKRPSVLNEFMKRYTDGTPSKLDTTPLRIKYGVVQKQLQNVTPPDPEKQKPDDRLIAAAKKAPASILKNRDVVKKPKVALDGTVESFVRRVVQTKGDSVVLSSRAKCEDGTDFCVSIKGGAPGFSLEVIVNVSKLGEPTVDVIKVNNKAVKGHREIERALL